MELTISQEQGRVPITVVHLNGRLDSGTAIVFEQKVREVIAKGMRYILIDMKNLTYISSSGLRVLHLLLQALHSPAFKNEKHVTTSKDFPIAPYKSHNLKLLDPPEHVLSTISIAGFDVYFEIYIDLGTAVASF